MNSIGNFLYWAFQIGMLACLSYSFYVVAAAPPLACFSMESLANSWVNEGRTVSFDRSGKARVANDGINQDPVIGFSMAFPVCENRTEG